jgi:hypothetical protein
MSRPRDALIVTVAALAVAGCSAGAEITAPTLSLSDASPRPTTPPPINRTLDLAAYHNRPCELLKSDQRAPFDGQKVADSGFLERCAWYKPAGHSVATGFLLLNSNHFAGVYRESNDHLPGGKLDRWWIFAPITIGGQPAVVVSESEDRAQCSVEVATGEPDSVRVEVRLLETDKSQDGCATAKVLAERIVGNLQR